MTLRREEVQCVIEGVGLVHADEVPVEGATIAEGHWEVGTKGDAP